MSFSTQNHAESSRNFVKNSVLDPKHVKFDQNSDYEGGVGTFDLLVLRGRAQAKWKPCRSGDALPDGARARTKNGRAGPGAAKHNKGILGEMYLI